MAVKFRLGLSLAHLKNQGACSFLLSTANSRASAMQPRSTIRVETIGGHATELLELQASQPSMQVVFVPGNPGIVAFYQDYLASLFRYFDGRASISAVSQVAHTAKDWENGQQFSLQQQIDHKAAFLEKHYKDINVPLVLVGHSIGAYIIIELLKRFPDKICCVVGLYPFLKTNPKSLKQTFLKNIAGNSFMRAVLSFLAGLLGRSPKWLSKSLVKVMLGRTWGPSAVDVTCAYLLQSTMVRNFMFMGMTEFQKLHEDPDWEFLREHRAKIRLLYGSNDHWGPLEMLQEIGQEVGPGLKASVEKQNISHDFCCSKFGSDWVASYTADTVNDILSEQE